MKKTEIIGIVGFNNTQLLEIKKKYPSLKFVDVNDNNFFSKKITKINALIILYEFPVKKNLSFFIKYKFKIFKKLKWVHLTRAGVDECEPYLKTYHFKLTAGKKIQGPNVSEHCMAMLLSISRGLFDQYKLNKYTHRPTEILNKRILIVGLGGIGTEVAKKLNVFGAKVDSIDHSFTKKKYIDKNYSIESLIKIAKNYDIIINCLPLTKITQNLFDKNFFYSMKKLSIFLSVSRDQTINIKDFKKFVKTKKLFGVAIDNTGSFKMKNKVEYYKKYNFLLTDHLAGVTTDNHRRAKLIYDNIDAYAKNKKINFLVSKQKGY